MTSSRKTKSFDTFVLLIFTFAYGTLFSWAIFYRWGSGPDIKPVDLSAWVQAIGSILAIAVAIYVPWRQRNHEILDQRMKDLKAENEKNEFVKVMTLAIAHAISAYESHCLFMKREFAHGGAIDRDTLPKNMFERSPEFDQFRTQLHLMGSRGHRVNQLISHQDLVRGSHSEFLRLKLPLPKPFLMEYKAHIERGAEMSGSLFEEFRSIIESTAP